MYHWRTASGSVGANASRRTTAGSTQATPSSPRSCAGAASTESARRPSSTSARWPVTPSTAAATTCGSAPGAMPTCTRPATAGAGSASATTAPSSPRRARGLTPRSGTRAQAPRPPPALRRNAVVVATRTRSANVPSVGRRDTRDLDPAPRLGPALKHDVGDVAGEARQTDDACLSRSHRPGRSIRSTPSVNSSDLSPSRLRTSESRCSLVDPCEVVTRSAAGAPGRARLVRDVGHRALQAEPPRELLAAEHAGLPAVVRRRLVPRVVDGDEVREILAERVERAQRLSSARREVERLGRRPVVAKHLAPCLGRPRGSCPATPRSRRSRAGSGRRSRGRSSAPRRGSRSRRSAPRRPVPSSASSGQSFGISPGTTPRRYDSSGTTLTSWSFFAARTTRSEPRYAFPSTTRRPPPAARSVTGSASVRRARPSLRPRQGGARASDRASTALRPAPSLPRSSTTVIAPGAVTEIDPTPSATSTRSFAGTVDRRRAERRPRVVVGEDRAVVAPGLRLAERPPLAHPDAVPPATAGEDERGRR